MDEILTSRCRIRALEPNDIDLLYKWENDPEVWRIGANTEPVSRARLWQWIENQQYDIYASRNMRLVIEVEDRVVGAVDIIDFNPQHMRLGLGILIYDHTDRRHGYAREVIEAMKDYSLKTLNIKQIWVEIDDFNAASIALFEGCGFERCGVRKDWICYEGVFSDVYEYQCILR